MSKQLIGIFARVTINERRCMHLKKINIYIAQHVSISWLD